MTIGTAVPDASLLTAVKHYFIQTVPVTETFSAGDYELQAISLIEKLFSEGHETLVMAGGSMLYVDAICKGWMTCQTEISSFGTSFGSS